MKIQSAPWVRTTQRCSCSGSKAGAAPCGEGPAAHSSLCLYPGPSAAAFFSLALIPLCPLPSKLFAFELSQGLLLGKPNQDTAVPFGSLKEPTTQMMFEPQTVGHVPSPTKDLQCWGPCRNPRVPRVALAGKSRRPPRRREYKEPCKQGLGPPTITTQTQTQGGHAVMSAISKA